MQFTFLFSLYALVEMVLSESLSSAEYYSKSPQEASRSSYNNHREDILKDSSNEFPLESSHKLRHRDDSSEDFVKKSKHPKEYQSRSLPEDSSSEEYNPKSTHPKESMGRSRHRDESYEEYARRSKYRTEHDGRQRYYEEQSKESNSGGKNVKQVTTAAFQIQNKLKIILYI